MEKGNSITINGNEYSFENNETILEVATRNGIYIPTLCHLKDTIPTGACRVCLVEVEKARGLVASCAMPAGNNMIVYTDSSKVIDARRHIVAFLIASGNHNCAARGSTSKDWTDFQLDVREYDKGSDICPAYGSCQLQELAYRYQVSDLLVDMNLHELEPHYPIEDVNPFIIRDFSRCILCGRCVKACTEIQVNNAISFGYRSAKAKIVTSGDNPLSESDCVFCGECIQACPVAALTLKDHRYEERLWELDRTESTCTYCGTGCTIDIMTNKEGKIVNVNGTKSGVVNRGSLCVKGRFGYDFVHHPDRLTTPLIKENNEFREASWDEALDLIASRLGDIKSKSGPDSIALLTSARCTNEENYLMNKFARAVIGTNNLDHCARL